MGHHAASTRWGRCSQPALDARKQRHGPQLINIFRSAVVLIIYSSFAQLSILQVACAGNIDKKWQPLFPLVPIEVVRE